MSYIVLARKYRPQTFSEVYAQEHITEILHNAILSNRIAHAYLFTGPRGVGKTSMARILAKSLNCIEGPTPTPCNKCHNCLEITSGTSSDVIEIDGATTTGVDDIRDLQKELLYAPSKSLYKIYIIDEVHMLSASAFNALLKTLEEPPDNVLFIFATTVPHKVLATIISRCQRYDFKRIPIEAIVKRLKDLAAEEKIEIDNESLYLIARKADGGMRDALSLLDQILSYCPNKVSIEKVREIFGLIPTQVYCNLLKLIAAKDSPALLTELQRIFEHGADLQDLINNLMDFLRIVILRKLGMAPLEVTSEEYATYDEIAALFSQVNLLYMMSYLIQTRNEVKSSGNPYLILEMVLIKLCRMDDMEDVSEALLRLNALKPGSTMTSSPPSAARPTPEKKSEAPRRPEPETIKKLEYTEDNLTQVWPRIAARIKQSFKMSGLALAEATIKYGEGFKLSIAVKGSSNFSSIQSRKEEIESILAEYFSHPIRLEMELLESVVPTKVDIVRKTLENLKSQDENLARYIEITDSKLSR